MSNKTGPYPPQKDKEPTAREVAEYFEQDAKSTRQRIYELEKKVSKFERIFNRIVVEEMQERINHESKSDTRGMQAEIRRNW